MSPQRRIFRKRLNIKDIKDGSTEEVIVKSIENVSLTDNVSTTNVDKADISTILEVFSKTGGKYNILIRAHTTLHLFKMLLVSGVAGRTLMM